MFKSDRDRALMHVFERWLENEDKKVKRHLGKDKDDEEKKDGFKLKYDPLDDDKSEEDKTKFDKVDDIVKHIDLNELENDGKLELIEIIIDSAQNSEYQADEFDDFVAKVKELVDNYKTAEDQDDEKKEDKKEEADDDKEAKPKQKKEEPKMELPEEGEEESL